MSLCYGQMSKEEPLEREVVSTQLKMETTAKLGKSKRGEEPNNTY